MSNQIVKIIDLAITNEKTICSYLQMYSKKLNKPSLKNLLISIIDQEKEHEKQLGDLKQEKNIQNAFNEELIAATSPDSFTDAIGNETDLIPTQFLQYLMKYYEQTSVFYNNLARAALDSELQFFFIKLSDWELKLKQWVQNRYDLELLSESPDKK